MLATIRRLNLKIWFTLSLKKIPKKNLTIYVQEHHTEKYKTLAGINEGLRK